MQQLQSLIRSILDFPKPGVCFRDLTTLFLDGPGFSRTINILAERHSALSCELIVGVEARGFVVGAPLAVALGKGFVPLRKPGKLPGATLGLDYSLEYGEDRLEVHADAIKAGTRVLMIDDLLATGGTMQAACKLVEQSGGEVVACGFVVELPALKGRERLSGYAVDALISFAGD